jgi:hypothetical protein
MKLPNLFGSNKQMSNGYTVLSNHNISKERQILPKPCSCQKGGKKRRSRRSGGRRRSRRSGGRRSRRSGGRRRSRRSGGRRRSRRSGGRRLRRRRSRKYRGGGHGFNQTGLPTKGLNWTKTQNNCKQRGGGPDSRYLGGKSPGYIYYGFDSPNSTKEFRGSYAPTTRKVYQCGGKRKRRRRK